MEEFFSLSSPWLEESLQVHACIQTCCVLCVAVKRQRRAPPELTNATFVRLAPAGMINGWVYVGVEAVLVRSGQVPRGRRLLLGQADRDDRLDALKAVFPGHDQTERRAVLIGERLAIESHR